MAEEEGVDPLEAYMQSINAELASFPNAPANSSKAPPPLPEEGLAAEDAEAPAGQEDDDPVDTNSLKNLSAEELIALARKKAKKLDLGQVDHDSIQYQPFRKDFYVESPEITRMTEEEVASYRRELDGIKIRGLRCPRPVRKWTQCGLSQRVLQVIRRCGYEKPTPIQAQAIPAIMNGRDLIGIAKTGSGKTVAFLLPMLRHVLDQPLLAINDGPIALIMTPTRELAMQTYSECRKFAKVLDLRVVCAYGGAPIKDQIADLKRGAEIIICTPGRFIDLLIANSGKVTNLRRVTYLVLDEADRMFDMGFGPQVLKIVSNIRPDKQAVLFSATFPQNMEALARKILVKPVEIIVGSRSTVSSDVEQLVEVVEEDAKFLKLLDVLGRWFETKSNRILIFVDRQDAADGLLKDLIRRGYPCNSLHGGKDQADRDCAIADFKAGVIPILIATSVAARGLDVKELKLVINYECPNHMEDYVHRVGRTGRAGNKGTSITFITPEQERYAPEILRALKASRTPIPAALQRLADSFGQKLKVGQAQTVGSGFGGKGLERIDEEHEKMRRTQKLLRVGEEELSSEEEEELLSAVAGSGTKRAKLATGTGEGVSPPMTALSKPVISAVAPMATPKPDAGTGAAPPSDDASAVTSAQPVPTPESASPPTVTAAAHTFAMPGAPAKSSIGMNPAAVAALRKINEKVQLAGSVEEEFDPIAAINARYSVPASSNSTSSEVRAIYDRPKGMGQMPKARCYYAEMDINDFPQAVRVKIAHKDTLTAIMEFCGAQLLIKGEFVAPGKAPREGQRKLYMRIDSEKELNVENALKEVRRIIFETLKDLAASGGLEAARFS